MPDITAKSYIENIRKIVTDIHAAQMFISRADANLRQLLGSEYSRIAQNRSISRSDASQCLGQQNIQANTSDALNAILDPSGAISPEITQEELFGVPSKVQEKRKKMPFSRKKGDISLSRQQVLANFRRIAAGKELLTLSDVNLILGYNKSTSGSFVKNAVRRGDLCAIPCGKEWKFLPIDLKAFVRAYFDRLDNSKGAKK